MLLTQMSSLALNSLATIMHYGNRTSGESPLIKVLIKGDITTRLKYTQRKKQQEYLESHLSKHPSQLRHNQSATLQVSRVN